MKTGDIVLFSGTCLISSLIKLFTLCRWSHVGVIIIDERYDEPLLYESTHNDKISCLDLGKPTQGVQIVRLQDRLNAYPGKVGIRRLRMVVRNDTMRYKLRLMRMAFVGRPFEKYFKQALGALFKLDCVNEDLESLFCSEKVAQFYIECGLLSKKSKAHHYTQADFARNISLENGYLTKIINIKG